MISETGNLWSNGVITLPKKWRDRWETKLFLMEENNMGHLVIKPILTDDIVYYEDKEGFGLHFPRGIPAETLYQEMKNSYDKLYNKKKSPRKKTK